MRTRALVLFVLVLIAVGQPAGPPNPGTLRDEWRTRAFAALTQQPLRFEPNAGQTNEDVRFVTRRGGATGFFTDEGATLVLRRPKVAATTLKLAVPHGRAVAPAGTKAIAAKTNYLVGRAWHTDLTTYASITYPSVLDGVDLVYHGEDGRLEFDFVVAPGTDVSTVAMAVDGADDLSLDANGDLEIHTSSGVVLQERPRVYQVGAHGAIERVAGRYRLGHTIGFEVAAYDRSRPLVIDPVIVYSTYIGGNGDDRGLAIDVGSDGSAFMTGATSSAAYPNANSVPSTNTYPNGTSDAFVAKLDPKGALVYFSYVGGSDVDSGNGISAASGRALVVGSTSSTDFPTTPDALNPAQPALSAGQSGFVFELNAAGNALSYGTYLQLSPNTSSESAISVTADANNVYVGGSSRDTTQQFSQDYGRNCRCPAGQACFGGGSGSSVGSGGNQCQTPPPQTDGAFALALARNGTGFTQTWSTLLGGTSANNVGAVNGLALDGTSVFAAGVECDGLVLGVTTSTNANNGCDAFLLRLDTATGTSNFGTYFGGENDDAAQGVAVTAPGHAVIVGKTSSTTIPIIQSYQPANAGLQDGFVAQLDTTASSSLVSSTYLGGANNDALNGVDVDPSGDIFVAGTTASPDMPVSGTATKTDTNDSLYVGELSADATTLIYGATTGSAGNTDGTALRYATNSLYIVGYTSNGLVTQSAAQAGFGGGQSDAFVAHLALQELAISPQGQTVFPNGTLTFNATGGAGSGYVFALSTNASGGTVDPATGAYVAGATGGVNDTVAVTDAFGSTATSTVTVSAGINLAPQQATVAPNSALVFTAGGGAGGYVFALALNGSGGTIDAATGAYTAGPTGGVTDTIVVKDSAGASTSATVTVTRPVATGAPLTLAPATAKTVPRGSVVFAASGGTPPYTYFVASNVSGGGITSGGQYIAGSRGNATDVVAVLDGAGQTASVTVAVGPGVTLTPSQASVVASSTTTFAATGGRPPYAWAASEGTITSAGVFTAPAGISLITVTAHDSLGNQAVADVSVGGALALAPSEATTFPRGTVQLTAFNGAGSGYTWTLLTSNGATIDAATGLYRAGTTGNVDDTVELNDEAGNRLTATIHVGPGVFITPATSTVASGARISFGIGGGSGIGYALTVDANASGATVDPNGVYTAGSKAGTDSVTLTDSVGNVAHASVVVSASTSAPAPTMTASPAPTATPTSTATPAKVEVGSGGGCNASGASGSSYALVGLVVLALRRRRRTAAVA